MCSSRCHRCLTRNCNTTSGWICPCLCGDNMDIDDSVESDMAQEHAALACLERSFVEDLLAKGMTFSEEWTKPFCSNDMDHVTELKALLEEKKEKACAADTTHYKRLMSEHEKCQIQNGAPAKSRLSTDVWDLDKKRFQLLAESLGYDEQMYNVFKAKVEDADNEISIKTHSEYKVVKCSLENVSNICKSCASQAPSEKIPNLNKKLDIHKYKTIK